MFCMLCLQSGCMLFRFLNIWYVYLSLYIIYVFSSTHWTNLCELLSYMYFAIIHTCIRTDLRYSHYVHHCECLNSDVVLTFTWFDGWLLIASLCFTCLRLHASTVLLRMCFCVQAIYLQSFAVYRWCNSENIINAPHMCKYNKYTSNQLFWF